MNRFAILILTLLLWPQLFFASKVVQLTHNPEIMFLNPILSAVQNKGWLLPNPTETEDFTTLEQQLVSDFGRGLYIGQIDYNSHQVQKLAEQNNFDHTNITLEEKTILFKKLFFKFLFNNNKKKGQYYYKLLVHSYWQGLLYLANSCIQSTIKDTLISKSPNYMAQLSAKGENIYLDIMLFNFTFVTKDYQEAPLAGNISTKFILTKKGFKLEQINFSNDILYLLTTSDNLLIGKKEFKLADRLERKNMLSQIVQSTILSTKHRRWRSLDSYTFQQQFNLD